jgi:hypothetical protein
MTLLATRVLIVDFWLALEDGGIVFLQNVGKLLLDYTPSLIENRPVKSYKLS